MSYVKTISDFNSTNEDYFKGLSDTTAYRKEKQIAKQTKMDDDDPDAYEDMPGDKKARREGKVKTSKHTKSYAELYGDEKENEALSDYEEDGAEYNKLYKGYKYKKKSKKKKNESSIMDFETFEKNLIKVKGDDEKKKIKAKGDIEIEIEGDDDSVEVKESRMDSDYLQRMLNTLAMDYKKQGEKDLYKFYDYLETRLNQSYPSGDVDRDDIEDLLNDPRFRRMKLDIPDWAIDVLFESIKNRIDEKVKQSTDRSPIDNKAIETGLKNKSDDTGVPIGILRAVMRRGMGAWKTGHRPGATQEQWGYARVNSFLTKQPGTWGKADADLAKEVRDGGHDKKLKKP